MAAKVLASAYLGGAFCFVTPLLVMGGWLANRRFAAPSRG
jgi:hypothetical protein